MAFEMENFFLRAYAWVVLKKQTTSSNKLDWRIVEM